jgi:glycosyltransferase involved in cell wall biosynthesis
MKRKQMPKVLYLQYTHPAILPPLDNGSQILARAGWQVLFLGLMGADETGSLVLQKHPNIEARYIKRAKPGFRQKINYVKYFFWTIYWVFRWRPFYVYVSDYMMTPIILVLSCVPFIRIIYHEHDTPNENTTGMFQRMNRALKPAAIKRAEFCILPNAERIELFKRETGRDKDVVCVWNCPSDREVAPARDDVNGKILRLNYFGMICRERLPESLLYAMCELSSSVHLRILGCGDEYLDHIKQLSQELGLGERVEFMGLVHTREQLLQSCGECDIGLGFYPSTTQVYRDQYMADSSDKCRVYLARGLAVLVSDSEDWIRRYVDPGFGLSCDETDIKDIVSKINWFDEHRREMRAMGEAGRNKIVNEWNYEKQFDIVIERMNATINGVGWRK